MILIFAFLLYNKAWGYLQPLDAIARGTQLNRPPAWGGNAGGMGYSSAARS